MGMMLGRRRWRIFGRLATLAVVALCAWQALRWLREGNVSKVMTPSMSIPPVEKTTVTPEELVSTFQGPIERRDGTEEWLVLAIRSVSGDAARVRFQFALSSPKMSARGEGEAFLDLQRIEFAGLRGQIRRDGNGRLVLTSVRLEGPPYWSLEAAR